MSTDLLWLIAGRSNKYTKRVANGPRFSADPFNNCGKATKRHAGFLQGKAAVVKVKGEKQLYVTVKNGEEANKPRKMYTKKVFEASAKASDVARAVSAVRPDLADVAFRRAKKLSKVVHRTKVVRGLRKAMSAKKEFKRKAVRAKKN